MHRAPTSSVLNSRMAGDRPKLTVAALAALQQLSAVDISPDGHRIAFVASAAAAEKGKEPASRVWIADEGTHPRQATRGPTSDLLPRWSPDARSLVFASDRDHSGRMSVYLLDSDAGEATPIGEIPGSVEDLAWSPEGDRLLVLAADLGSDRAVAQTATKISEQGAPPADPRVVRPQEFWRRLYSVDVSSGETSEVGPSGVNVWEVDWRGGAVVAVVSDDPSESAWYRASLALLDLDARSAETIHTTDWQLSVPRLSPDGGRVAFVEGFCSDRGILAGSTSVLELGSGAARELAPDLDVSWLKWRDDSTLVRGSRGSGTVRISLDGWWTRSGAGRRRSATAISRASGRATTEGCSSPRWRRRASRPRCPSWTSTARRRAGSRSRGSTPSLQRSTWLRASVRLAARDGLEIEGCSSVRKTGDRPAARRARARRADGLVDVRLELPTSAAAGRGRLHGAAAEPARERRPRPGVRAREPRRPGRRRPSRHPRRRGLARRGGGRRRGAGRRHGRQLRRLHGRLGDHPDRRFAASMPMACSSNWLSFHNTTNIGRFDELFLAADPYEPDGAYFARSPVVHARKVRRRRSSCTASSTCARRWPGAGAVSGAPSTGGEVELVGLPARGPRLGRARPPRGRMGACARVV